METIIKLDTLINGIIYALLAIAMLYNYFQLWHKVPKNYIFARLLQGLWSTLCSFFLIKGYFSGWFINEACKTVNLMETATNGMTLLNAIFSIALIHHFMEKMKQ